LLKCDPIVFPLKDVDLLNIVILAAHKVAFPGECELGVLCALQEDSTPNGEREEAPWWLRSSLYCQRPRTESTTSEHPQGLKHSETESASS
jgi:hypothetical protein